MVEVGGAQPETPVREGEPKEVEEHDGVDAAGNGDEDLFARREEPGPTEVGR